MSENTATTENVFDSFIGWGDISAEDWKVAAAEFNAWLASVKADAWDEGWRGGYADANFEIRRGALVAGVNPYRAKQEREYSDIDQHDVEHDTHGNRGARYGNDD